MPKYCCFLDPDYSDAPRSLTDVCPQCGRAYGFALTDVSAQIGQYRIIRPLDRGFYSVAYVAEAGTLRRRKVIKVAFKATYDFFRKDFEQECREHSRIAEGSQHIVGIDDMTLNVPVVFGPDTFICHIAEMDYVEGPTLNQYLASGERLSARSVAQIAIDLFTILRELADRQVHHNDLNPANLIVQKLNSTNRRADAEDEFIRVMAIDLNSASDASKSDPEGRRLGDLHWVVKHLRDLVGRLLPEPDATPDLEYRLASVLEERAFLLSPEATKQRIPTFDECIDDIHTAVRHVSSPWREPAQLRRFNDAYNAQTMAAWFVPLLIVDPEDKWVSSITGSGPQVVTGMRGCGKTMLLRALQFHARVTLPSGSTSPSEIESRLIADGYVGLYASCMRLLDDVGIRQDALRAPYTRLLLAYAREALLAIRHLREICPHAIAPAFFRSIGSAVADWIDGGEQLRTANSEFELERLIHEIAVRVNRGDGRHGFHGHPSQAFPALADAVRQSAPSLWGNATTFFLLDDVSTRFLKQQGIEELMSGLLFLDPRCAFKMTTESQTLELILRSPGQVEKAREGRDYQVFDLGAEVNAVIRSTRTGKSFVERVLQQRAKLFTQHPNRSPREILGDITLDALATQIATSTSNSRQRKSAYWGLSALRGVCVGDIGDTISLYEVILKKGGSGPFPIRAELQSECYQEFCSRRLYDLHRRRSDLKDCALSFAEASHALLIKSAQDITAGKDKRLRQFLKLYVRVTVGDPEAQIEKLRDLIDSGVFVLDGGTFRSKTRDGDITRQFKLTFRKLFGLSNFVGLAERDRFELSGEDLIRWLDHPAQGKEVLLRNLHAELDVSEQMEPDQVEEAVAAGASATVAVEEQRLMFEQPTPTAEAESGNLGVVQRRSPRALKIEPGELSKADIDTLVLGLGFEERTLASVRSILDVVSPKRAVAVRYSEPGQSREIERLLKSKVGTVDVHDYSTVVNSGLTDVVGNVLIDVTGLAKPVIFHAVRNVLRVNRKVWVCRTSAELYYPLDKDIEPILRAEQAGDSNAVLEAVSGVLTGEEGPYTLTPLLEYDSDDSRRRLLCAFSSAKHQRLLTLLDNREYDAVAIFTQKDDKPRSRIARFAAEVAARRFPGAFVEQLATNDLEGAIFQIASAYESSYVDRGFNFEFGLTGSKLQTVACAASSVVLKAAQAWYVRPRSFDPARFTKGIGEMTLFAISLGDR